MNKHMGFFDKLFGTAKEEMVEMEAGVDVTEEIADEAAAMTCTCTPEEKCDGCKAKEAVETSNSDMDEDNLD